MNESDLTSSGACRANARVNSDAIAANIGFLRARLTGGAELCAVVKADGYGHGMVPCAIAAMRGGATRLAVVTVAEAEALAAADLGLPLLMLGPIHRSEIDAAVATGAELTAWDRTQVEAIAQAAQAQGKTIKLHIKLDTGMGRFGASDREQAHAALERAVELENVAATAVWTHFATADERSDAYFDEQLARFCAFADEAKSRHPGLLAHAANSAATLRDPASHFDFVRTGIAIYGLDPFGGDARATGLLPALSLHSYVASIRPLAAGESVGYGRRFRAEEDTMIATIPIGYGDGWRRILTNNCDVLIAAQRCAQRGTVSMDSIMVELGAGSKTQVGAPVTLIGREGSEEITCEEVAERAHTINYEITCGLSPRTLRTYDGAE